MNEVNERDGRQGESRGRWGCGCDSGWERPAGNWKDTLPFWAPEVPRDTPRLGALRAARSPRERTGVKSRKGLCLAKGKRQEVPGDARVGVEETPHP